MDYLIPMKTNYALHTQISTYLYTRRVYPTVTYMFEPSIDYNITVISLSNYMRYSWP